ncbi:MAG: hypothetical protein LQ341_004728 [Variospora aurantia]|nr:MAG: hypothetical protein LQ341_004728 [Variospora aurantia]
MHLFTRHAWNRLRAIAEVKQEVARQMMIAGAEISWTAAQCFAWGPIRVPNQPSGRLFQQSPKCDRNFHRFIRVTHLSTIKKVFVEIVAHFRSGSIQKFLQPASRLQLSPSALQIRELCRSSSSLRTLKAAAIKPTTAQDVRRQDDASRPIVMNNDSKASPETHEVVHQHSNPSQEQPSPAVNAALPHHEVPLSKEETTVSNDIAIESNKINAVDRSDSEAETVVLEGKQETSRESTGKAIKNEDDSDHDGSRSTKINGLHRFSESDRDTDYGSDRPSLKRKRVALDVSLENALSSNLSSSASSPAARPHSSQGSVSDSDHTRSTPPLDEEGIQQKHVRSRQRGSMHSVDEHNRNKRGKSDPNSVALHRKERRENRSATHHQISRRRSDSPPSRRRMRSQSASLDLPDQVKRKQVPPPVLVERRRKTSEDTHGDSDDSSSVHSHPHLPKLASVEHTAISPAKISMKKNRDRNGRTLLARACAIDFHEAQKWLRERPQDIDVPDNAGNTPLQIASLEGLADIVQLLLDAGCDINCKNIDMETPLIDAVENGHLGVVQLLLAAGLDPRQSNAKGEEPLDLVNPDNDDYDEIRAALVVAKESNSLRRPSEDHSAQHRDNDMSSVGASAASPTDGQVGKSPPPMGLGARRRTARSQQTQDSLLWVNPTPAKLREACGRGDLPVVNYILGMRPDVGTDAVIAAARGGHDVVLEILFAIGQLEHDPDPVESDEFKPGRNTPMLAAIGRGHIPVIRLLVSQRGFNPTRRIFKGLTYHELAKERQGSNWEEEYSILKEAYDDYKLNGGRRSNHSSPRKSRTRKAEAVRSSISPSSAHTRRPSLSNIRTASEPEIKREHSHRAPPKKHLRLTEEARDSAIVSDRESEWTGKPEPKAKVVRSVSDAGALTSKRSDAAKPKRKLLSRNDFNSDHDIKRRASTTLDTAAREQIRRQSGDPTPMDQRKQKRRKMSESSTSVPKARRGSSKEVHSSKVEPGKKRPRLSTSPQPHLTHGEKSSDVPKTKKKRKVDSAENTVIRDPQHSDTFIKSGPAMVANMIASPEQVTSPSEPPSRAPVANMGISSTSPTDISPTEVAPHNETHSPMSGIEQTVGQHLLPPERSEKVEIDAPMPDLHQSAKQSQGDGEAEYRQLAENDHKKRLQAVREEEERREYRARLEQQQQAEEAERQARKEHEEEEARMAKKRREEELARRRAEQERLRREEQERRRAELEERERLRRIRLLEEEQQQLRDALPNSLRRAAEMNPEKARQPQEVRKWLPLYTVTTREIDPGCDENMADERWIANVQAAPVLAIKDLDLSQYTAWTRRALSPSQRQSLWRQLRNMMSQADINPLNFTWQQALELDSETYPKFRDLKSMFWIKLAEFMDIVPRHPHLGSVRLKTRAMVVHDDPWGGVAGTEMMGNGFVNGGEGKGLGLGLVNGFR